MASADRLYFTFPFVLDSIQCSALIPCSPSARFHAATSYGFNTMLCIDLVGETFLLRSTADEDGKLARSITGRSFFCKIRILMQKFLIKCTKILTYM